MRYNQELFSDRDPDTGFLTGNRYVFLQTQFAWLSDKNFFEQYFKNEFDFGPNQETAAYLTGYSGQWFGSVLGLGGQRRSWLTETRWLPEASGAVVGRSLFDLFSYTSRASVGYAEFRPAVQPPAPYYPFFPNERNDVDTVRGDWWQELSLPMRAGPVGVTPYGVLDLTGYSHDVNGQSVGRVYAAGGVRSALTLARPYRDVSSELFNLRGLNHKVTLSGNYFNAHSNVPYTQLPLLDRLNDDQIDQTFRTVTPLQNLYLWKDPAGPALMTQPYFNPQQYAIRRVVDNRVDTRDTIEVVQLDLFQRLQTKRGYVGREHTVDWLTLDVSASLFPDPNRDNFGKGVSFVEYNTIWNVGDRTAVTGGGWFDPFDFGARYYNIGVYQSRTDNTSIFVSYRQTDPLRSKAVVTGVNYQLTKKYMLGAVAAYDFGLSKALTNVVTVTRTGTDVTFTVGFTYNALQNNFGFLVSVVPNLVAARGGGGILSPAALR